MEIRKSIKKRRLGVVTTLIALCGIIVSFEYYRIEPNESAIIVIGIISIIAFLTGFIMTFVKTGLWGFIHKPLKKLDERELALTSKSLRYAYMIFTVVVLILLFALAILDIKIDVVLVASLLLFAHMLPAIYIAWFVKEV